MRVTFFVRSWIWTYFYLHVWELFFVIRVIHNGLLLTKRYVPPSEGKYCIYIYIYVSVPTVPFWSSRYHKNTISFLDFTRPFDLNVKTHFKTTRGEGLRIPSRADLRRYIAYHSRLSTPPRRKQSSKWFDQHIRNAHFSKRTYVSLFLQTVKNVYTSVPPVSFWSCLHQENSTRIYKGRLIWTWKHIQNYQAKKATHTTQNEF